MSYAILDRILIPLDGSMQSEAVVPLLEPIVRRSGSEIFLVRALAPSQEREPFQEADRYLKGVADRFLDEGVCAHTLVSVGSASQVIERLSVDEEISLIVLSPREGHDPSMGPVLEPVMQRSARPVLVLRQAAAASSRRAEFRPYRSLLLPLDGSETSRRSLPLALELAAVLDARVVLMRVIERPAEKPDALHDLQKLAARLHRQGFIAEIWIESGDPAEQILQVCRDEDIQLIVLATQGHSGPSERLFGTVTRRLMMESPVPVLAIHAPGGP